MFLIFHGLSSKKIEALVVSDINCHAVRFQVPVDAATKSFVLVAMAEREQLEWGEAMGMRTTAWKSIRSMS